MPGVEAAGIGLHWPKDRLMGKLILCLVWCYRQPDEGWAAFAGVIGFDPGLRAAVCGEGRPA